MTNERAKAINDWLNINCRYCIHNADYGTDFVNCQSDCEVKKDIGIACTHYEENDLMKPPPYNFRSRCTLKGELVLWNNI